VLHPEAEGTATIQMLITLVNKILAQGRFIVF